MSRKPEKNQRIQVFARCRPLNSIERKQDSQSIVEVLPKEKKIFLRDKNKEFTFDKVFPPDSKQIDVYKSVAEPLIQEVLKGYNCTVFAYGQTGTGKTYTMEGERNNAQYSWEDDPGAGIIPRSLHQLFDELNKGESVEYCVKVSFLELYNEELLDLLSSKEELSKLRIYEVKGSLRIDDKEEVVVKSKDEVYTLLEKGTARRQTAATLLNAQSSRSHTVFSVTVHIKENTVDGEELVKTGKLNLVDLAGSECVARSGCEKQRFRETSNINQSLLTLGRVITALIEKQPHVPYRESKLTRLLQDSLGGHTKTSIIATISPAQCNTEETSSTLEYANKAKSITIKPVINQKMTKRALIRDYTEEIERLRKDLVAIRNKDGYFVDADNFANMEKEISESKEKIKLLEDKIEIQEFQNKTVEQSLSLTQEELRARNELYDEIVEKLNNTEKALTKTVLEKDEKQYLLTVHCNTEKKLSEQARSLLHVADQTTDDVEKLHMKLDRKKRVEETNEERCKNFKKMCQLQFTHLDDLVRNSKNEQESNLCSLKESLDQFVSGFMGYAQHSSEILNKITSNQNKSVSDFSSNLSNQIKQQESWSDSLLEDVSVKKNELTTDQELFYSETIPSLSEKFLNMTTELKQWMESAHLNLCQKIEKLHTDIKTQSEEKYKTIDKLTSNIDEFCQHHHSVLSTLKEKTRSLSERQCEMNRDLAEQRKQLLACLSNCDKLVGTQTSLNEDLSDIENVHQSIKDYIPELQSTQKSLEDHLETSKSETTSYLLSLDDISCTVKNNEEFTTKLNTTVDFHRAEVSEVTKFIKDNQKKQESCLEKIEKEIVSNGTAVKNNYESANLKLKEMQDSLSDVVNEETVYLGECKGIMHDKVSQAEAIVKHSGKHLDEVTERLSAEILQRDLEIEKFIYEDLEKDIPTGTTPQRKTYTYPRYLAKTSPDDKLLHRLHMIRNDDTNAAVNAPLDSSFDDSGEYTSSLNREQTRLPVVNVDSSETQVHNVSFMSEDDYLTGCDTESNASSMSDLSSIDGSRNKENTKHFSKPSHLPKRKKTKKLLSETSIPTPTLRKPLHSKNPSSAPV